MINIDYLHCFMNTKELLCFPQRKATLRINKIYFLYKHKSEVDDDALIHCKAKYIKWREIVGELVLRRETGWDLRPGRIAVFLLIIILAVPPHIWLTIPLLIYNISLYPVSYSRLIHFQLRPSRLEEMNWKKGGLSLELGKMSYGL